jgi:hypothetical protein
MRLPRHLWKILQHIRQHCGSRLQFLPLPAIPLVLLGLLRSLPGYLYRFLVFLELVGLVDLGALALVDLADMPGVVVLMDWVMDLAEVDLAVSVGVVVLVVLLEVLVGEAAPMDSVGAVVNLEALVVVAAVRLAISHLLVGTL